MNIKNILRMFTFYFFCYAGSAIIPGDINQMCMAVVWYKFNRGGGGYNKAKWKRDFLKDVILQPPLTFAMKDRRPGFYNLIQQNP